MAQQELPRGNNGAGQNRGGAYQEGKQNGDYYRQGYNEQPNYGNQVQAPPPADPYEQYRVGGIMQPVPQR